MSITFEEFQKRLQMAGPRFQRNLAQLAIKTALNMESSAKINATTYPKVVTGRLRSSIQGTVDSPDNHPIINLLAGGQSRSDTASVGGKTISVEPGQIVNYAEKLEFGSGSIAPRRFLGRAFDEHEPLMVREMKALLLKSLRETHG